MALTDLILIPAILLAVGIIVYSGYYMLDAINGSMIRTPTTAPILDSGLSAVASFDWMFPLITTMMGLVSIALAYFFPSHPIFLVLGVIMFALTFFIVPTISNIFSDFSSVPELSTTKAAFPLMDWTFQNFPMIISGFGLMMTVVLYSRYKNQGGSE